MLENSRALIKRNKKVTVMIVMMIMKRVRKEKEMIMNVIRRD